jgi:hypothetical protein
VRAARSEQHGARDQFAGVHEVSSFQLFGTPSWTAIQSAACVWYA